MKKSIIKIIPFIIFISILSLSGCNISREQDITVHVFADFPVTDNLQEMYEAAHFVVIGHYTAFDSTWNMARNPENPIEEDSNNYTEGHLYHFQVDEVLKGSDIDSSILVNHRYLEILMLEDSNAVADEQGIIIKEATKKSIFPVENLDRRYIKPQLEQTYMLFLLRNDFLDHYYGAIEPFSILFDENQTAILQSNLTQPSNMEESVEIEMDGKKAKIINETEAEITDKISGMSLDEIKSHLNQNE